MRVLSVILLGIAAFCLYAAASGSLILVRAAILGRDPTAFGVLTAIGWIAFALFIGLGLACSWHGRRARAAAVTILVGLLLALSVWLTMGLMLLSPAFDATMPPGHDYRAVAPAPLLGVPVLLILTALIGYWLRRGGQPGPSGESVTGLPQ